MWLARRFKGPFLGTEVVPLATGSKNDGSNDWSLQLSDLKNYILNNTTGNVFILIQNSVTGSPVTNYSTTPSPSLLTPTGNEIYLFTPMVTNAVNATLTINFSSPDTEYLTKDSTLGLVHLALNDLVIGTTYAVIKETTTGTYQIIGTNGSGGIQVQTDWNQTNSLFASYIKNKPNFSLGNIYYIGVNGSDTLGVKGSMQQSFATLAHVNTLIVDFDTIVFLPGVTDNTASITITKSVFINIGIRVNLITPILLSASCLISGESRYSSNLVAIDTQGTNGTTIQNCYISSFRMWSSGTSKCTGCYITGVSKSSGSGIGILTLIDCELVTVSSDVGVAYNATNVIINHTGTDLYLCNGGISSKLNFCTVNVTGGFFIRMGEAGIFKAKNTSFNSNGIKLKKIPSVSSAQPMQFNECTNVATSGTYGITSDNSASGNDLYILFKWYGGAVNKTFDPTSGTGIPNGVLNSPNVIIDSALI